MKRTPKINRIQQRRKQKFRLGHCLILCFFLAVIGSSAVHLWTLHESVKKQLAVLNQKKIDLIEQQKRYENEIVQLNTPSYIEQLAREQLGLVKHGEIIIAPKR
ncbi:MAG: septum formation initiator family protein [Desulfitobacteriaceae bacterium]